jgi:hypothetical protein
MRTRFLPSLDMRVAFYAGVLAFSCQDLVAVTPEAAWRGIVGIFYPMGMLFLIPAFQLRSWKWLLVALFLSPLLMIAFSFLVFFCEIDNRTWSGMPILVPGGVMEMNPGAPAEALIWHLVIFATISTAILRRTYRRTLIFKRDYRFRVIVGTLVLSLVLLMDIEITEWRFLGFFSEDHTRAAWIFASTTWLISTGLWSAFIFGVKPAKGAPEKPSHPLA